MIEQNKYTLAFIFFLAVTLTACVSSPPSNTGSATNAGRYELEYDSPIVESIDINTIPEVIPQPVNRTMAGNRSPYEVNGLSYTVMASEVGYQESGRASWYGRKFHGHLTSNGEIYDMFTLTAAHKSLPIPSFVKVTNLDNGKSVVVRVNDRGPFHADRIIDLSYAAAAKLDYADLGTARVHVEALTPWLEPTQEPRQEVAQEPVIVLAPVLVSNTDNTLVDQEEIAAERQLIEENVGQEYLQLGAFSNLESAESLLDSVIALIELPAFIRSDDNTGANNILHRVRLGPLNETIQLDNLIQRIIDAGLGTPFRVRQ
ncbi:MAG: septal ring lytic transglycosylase RlpA family lipoprotein [SAR86 cluster bacterium]|uniref:Endolytic peptidoglycan transglycosylase RlpA n=1 Tax=SAR86 cluster bacterium TaxID=2030880 RepID=A0A2A5CAU4_9GAMM|nr:MAG: septal ring lytic transglycosylase RlpA family lipoprotein [SAR86 cluster bacterium]